MSKNFSQKSSGRYLSELKKIKAIEARSFFLQHGYSSSSFEVPEYYGAKNLEQIKLEALDWNSRTPVLITSPINFLTPKGYLSWRNFSLLHPYIFVHIVNEITELANWEELKKILTKETLVNCYSTPSFNKDSSQKIKSSAISRWIQMAESDLVKDSVKYAFLTTTDIKSFYPSIYTHSIAWAINGKKTIRDNRFDFTLLGNKLDKLFQNARDGQTNGIPVGSMVSDFIAEVILKDIDVKLSEWISENKLKTSIVVSRYRDDFRVLSKTEEEGKRFLKALSKIIETHYGLSLNSEKTHIYPDIIEGTFRDWANEIKEDYLLRQVKYEELSSEVKSSFLKDLLFRIYRLQRKYPDGRSSITLLSKLIDHFDDEFVSLEVDVSDVETIISILRKLSLLREEVSAQVYILLDLLLAKLNKPERRGIIKELLKIVSNESDYDYQVIWLYRLCLSHLPEECKDILSSAKDSPLVKILTESFRNDFYDDYEIFEAAKNISKSDVAELRKFEFVDDNKLVNSENVQIDREFIVLFKY